MQGLAWGSASGVLEPAQTYVHFVLLTSLVGGKAGVNLNTEYLSAKEFLLQVLWFPSPGQTDSDNTISC